MKQMLSVEQSAGLIKRGVNENKAHEIKVYDDPLSEWTHRGCPLFTLTDLLSLLPKHIRIEHRHYYLRMNTFVLTDEKNPMWIARYITSNSAITLHERWSEELIDALYKLIISLLDNHVKLD